MSHYIYHSDLPETAPRDPEIPEGKEKKGISRRMARILYACLFIAIAGLSFAAVVFLSGTFISEDGTNGSNTAWKASASYSVTMRSDLSF